MAVTRSRIRRRRLGLILLGLAVVLLVLGESLLKSFLAAHVVVFVVYWLVCFVLTVAAAGTAIIDLARVGIETREEQRDLIQKTIEEVERERRDKVRKP